MVPVNFKARWRVFLVSSMACLAVMTTSINTPAAELLNVYVVNYPLQYFAERIGGDHVEVTLPAPTDEDPAYWTPSVAEIGAYQQADLILLNGAGYAKWISKVSLPRSKTIDTSKSFKDRYIAVKEVTTHSHGPEGEHAHEDLAFTTWLDPSLASMQAEAVLKALIRKRPELKSEFQANFRSLRSDLQLLDDRLKGIVSQRPETPLLFSHPVYDYLIQRYGINARSVHWEPDEVPTEQNLAELKRVLENHPAQWMIWEGAPIKSAVETLAALGIESVIFNPCANRPPSGDYMSVMQQNATNLETVYR